MPGKSADKPSPNLNSGPKKHMTLSVKVNFNTEVLSARFHSTINSLRRTSNRCTCLYDGLYHVPSPRSDDTNVQRFRFILQRDAHISKARTAIQKAQKDVVAVREQEFGFAEFIRELTTVLARLCDGRTAPHNAYWDRGNSEMRPFRASTHSPSAHRDRIHDKVREHLTENQVRDNELGYIYILRSHNPTTQAELKIGFSRFHPQHRSQELAKCLIRPEVVAHTQLLPFAMRVEALVHTELEQFRKVQWCSWCHRNHQEWFTVTIDRARRTVARWSKFILLRPYVSGKLRDDVANLFENSKASTSDSSETLDPESYWDKAVQSISVDESKYSRTQQIGTYLNAIWMYRNIHDWTDGAPVWKKVPTPRSFDAFYDEYLCSDDANEVRMALSDLDFETLRSIYFDEKGGPSSNGLRTILFGKDAAGSARYFDLGYNYLPTEVKTQAAARNVTEVLDLLNATTTGARSVINPRPGTTDSPIGNATMIPVLELKDLRNVSDPVKTWIGYDKTNMGFQAIQEAYCRGEWSDFPQFTKPWSTRFLELLRWWRWGSR